MMFYTLLAVVHLQDRNCGHQAAFVNGQNMSASRNSTASSPVNAPELPFNCPYLWPRGFISRAPNSRNSSTVKQENLY